MKNAGGRISCRVNIILFGLVRLYVAMLLINYFKKINKNMLFFFSLEIFLTVCVLRVRQCLRLFHEEVS